MKQKLCPNCSEIVWRLNVPSLDGKRKILKALEDKKENVHATYMGADFPHKFLKTMIDS